MKPKLLLFLLLLSCGILNAQDTIRTLVISEIRLDDARHSYVEISNVGTTTLNLAEFEVGVIGPWTVPWTADDNYWFMLPDRDLEPGQSFVISAVYDWNPEMWLKDPDHYARILNKKEFWSIADIKLHFPESPTSDPTDSITPYYHALEFWGGRDCFYIRHHVSETDSVLVDQVNGIFDEEDGTSRDAAHDVAGVTNATSDATLIRKFSVKTGNTDFESARGQDLAESEWMPIKHQFAGNQYSAFNNKLFWTAGNHGDYNLDETTLTSSTIDISWADSILTVPWGVRNDDSIMSEFDKKPGIAWHYTLAGTYEDSAYYTARTGDILTVYTCGNDLDMINFRIQVAEPTNDANIVIPKRVPDPVTGDFTNSTYGGAQGALYIVTDNATGMDTIYGATYRGIEFATRVDTMFKYLEKAPAASWEIVWVDGMERTDLKHGDILKVTAENGAVKEYFIKVDGYRPSHDAYLSSITWPDIPEMYKDLFGWVGDTIPNFVRSKYDYKVQVPADVSGIPALLGKNEDVDAKLEVDRAKNLFGTPADRTVTFTSTAEDDTSILVYKVQLEKEKNPADIQPWAGEPFLSQLIFWEQWNNGFLEICNPGNQPLDLSNYMIFFQWSNDPAQAITWFSGAGDWANRYAKYIPGYKWQDETNWAIQPGIAIQDLNINPIVQPGDVFVLGDIRSSGISGYPWFASEQCDIDFAHDPWGENYTGESCARQWTGANFFLYKILNDSIKLGLKPANNPNDFELIETFGGGDGSAWVIGGRTSDMINGWVRKPQYFEGKTEFNGSFGTDAETSEWIQTDRAYFDALNVPWPDDILLVADGLGSHFMDEVTVYKSTVASNDYKVSEGYSMDESIRGVVTGTKVSEFLDKILKANEEQALTLKSSIDGSVLSDTAVLINGDSLVVISADSTNTSKYVLEVTDEGLSDDAVLTSTVYTITVGGETGTVSGFEYGTALKTVVENVTVPAGAVFNVIDANDAYVPLKMLNFDTAYVDVQVNDQIFFEVIAEDGVTKIVYQLQPDATSSDAFVTSNVFLINQEAALIDLIPEGTSVNGFFMNLIPAPGATMQLVDKFGYVRVSGNVVMDDLLIVTAEDGVTTKTYYLTMLEAISKNYLAYVLSDVYSIDQIDHMISGEITEATQVDDFLANLFAATGASIMVVDIDGNENTGDIDAGDVLVVTAADGETMVVYSIDIISSINDLKNNSIIVYPNPTSSRVFISGLEKGHRIYISNIIGVRILNQIATNDREIISLEGQPHGVYFITVNNTKEIIGRFKLILK